VSDREYVISLVKGADVYRKQGLYAEAKEKYLEALSCVSRQGDSANKKTLKEMVEKRIQLVNEGIAEAAKPDEPPQLSAKVQDIIKNLFSFSGTKEGAALEGAVALMKFGQYKRAIEEFERLLTEGIQPLIAARNIIKCSFLIGPPEDAVERFRQWGEKSLLSSRELAYTRDFLQSILKERGIETELPFPPAKSAVEQSEKGTDEIEPEISTVTIDFEDGQLKGNSEEFKVTFQFGNVLSVIVPSSRKNLIQSLQPGSKLYHMGFYSPMALFRGTGKVTAKTLIKHGPRKGDYLFDITIDEG
jgi:tetratricopeptide (TPR) repeat protein